MFKFLKLSFEKNLDLACKMNWLLFQFCILFPIFLLIVLIDCFFFSFFFSNNRLKQMIKPRANDFCWAEWRHLALPVRFLNYCRIGPADLVYFLNHLWIDALYNSLTKCNWTWMMKVIAMFTHPKYSI